MSVHDLDTIIVFFNQLSTIEQETWAYALRDDVDEFDVSKEERRLLPFFEGGPRTFIERLDYPDEDVLEEEPEWFEENRARKVTPRVLHAVQSGRVDEVDLAYLYVPDFEDKGFGMTNRFAVAEVDGAPRIVARHTRCGLCKGLGCGTCAQQGWRYVSGRKLKKATVVETRKLVEPTHAPSKTAWDALG